MENAIVYWDSTGAPLCTVVLHSNEINLETLDKYLYTKIKKLFKDFDNSSYENAEVELLD